MNSRDNDLFFRFSAVTLILTAAAKLYSATGSAKVFQIQDQVLHLGYRPLLVLAAAAELAVATLLLRSGSNQRRFLVLLWLSSNFFFYHWGTYLLGLQTCPCLGHLTDALPLPPGSAELALQVLVLFWLFTSLKALSPVWAGQWPRLLHLRGKVMREASLQSKVG